MATKTEKIKRIKENPTVAFDFGYGFIKALCGKSELSFPTFHKENRGSKVEQSFVPDYLVKLYENDEDFHTFAVGEFARMGKIKKEWSEAQALNPESVKIYMGTALWLLSEKNDFPESEDGIIYINVSVGLPLDYYMAQKSELEKMLKDFEIDVEMRNIRKKFIVDSSLVNQQGVGAFYDLVFNLDGSAKNTEELIEAIDACSSYEDFDPVEVAQNIIRFGIGFCDIGYNSIDNLLVTKKGGNFVIVDELAQSLMNKAMYKAYEDAADGINRDMDIGLGVFELEEAVKESENHIKKNRIVIDATDYLERAYKSCAEDLESELERKWSDRLHNIGVIMLCGGGAYDIAKHLRVDVLTLIQENAPFANARGYLKKITKMISELDTAKRTRKTKKEAEAAQ